MQCPSSWDCLGSRWLERRVHHQKCIFEVNCSHSREDTIGGQNDVLHVSCFRREKTHKEPQPGQTGHSQYKHRLHKSEVCTPILTHTHTHLYIYSYIYTVTLHTTYQSLTLFHGKHHKALTDSSAQSLIYTHTVCEGVCRLSGSAHV